MMLIITFQYKLNTKTIKPSFVMGNTKEHTLIITEEAKKKFGKQIKNYRELNGLTQEMVKVLAGVNENTLRRIENGQMVPRFSTLALLSDLYKIDCISMLNVCNFKSELINIYNALDQVTIMDSTESLNIIIKDVKTKMKSNSLRMNDFDRDLLCFYLTTLSSYYSNESCEKIVNQFELLISKKIKGFSFKDLDAFSLNPFELKVVMIIGLIHAQKNNMIESNRLLHYCLDKIKLFEHSYLCNYKLQIKILYNLSYNYHLLGLNEQALSLADAGLKILKEKDSIFNMSFLLARKSIAMYKLKHQGYIKPLKQAINLFEINEQYEYVEMFTDIAKRVYNIDI